MSIDFKSWYENAKAEFEKLQSEKAELERALEDREKQIAVLERTVNFLAPLVGEAVPAAAAAESTGMTGSIREILKKSPEPLTASEIRDSLETLGFDMKSYSNPLATIHTILRRLGESEEVETTHEMNSGKRTAYMIPVGSGLAVEKIWGKPFQIGTVKGFIGKGRLRRAGKNYSKEG
jgi:prefoldin subunit 5